jgi:hypothetical protein
VKTSDRNKMTQAYDTMILSYQRLQEDMEFNAIAFKHQYELTTIGDMSTDPLTQRHFLGVL